MKLKCPGCGVYYQINSDKLPENPEHLLKCPSCTEKISLNKPKELSIKEKFIKEAKALPPVPEILIRARQIINDETKDIDDLANLLENDQGMASRLLNLANSAYYSLRSPVHSVHQACLILGADLILQMVTLAATSKLLNKELSGYSISSGEMFLHSIATAFSARLIALETHPFLAVDAFSAGILHDCGKLIIDEHLVKHKNKFNHRISQGKEPHTAEKEIFGFNHAELGHDFLVQWNIPYIQAKAVYYHHKPSKSKKDPLSYILHLADSLVKISMDAKLNEHLLVEQGTLEFLKLPMEKLEDIRLETIKSQESIFHGLL